MAEIKVLAFAGSLRDDSFNRRMLDVARDLTPEGMKISIYDIDDIPLFDQDLEKRGMPEGVRRFHLVLDAADALLIATPEYQHGMTGVLKNALDWASRPPGKSPMQNKPVAILSATPGATGGVRAQEQLRQTLTYNKCITVPAPEVQVAHVHQKFDSDGNFTDEEGKKFLRELLDNLAELTRDLSTDHP
jgi:chromate reductase, NAD(P)H dehydrogenase (quinone)